jgi:predicted restriction endonuclease
MGYTINTSSSAVNYADYLDASMLFKDNKTGWVPLSDVLGEEKFNFFIQALNEDIQKTLPVKEEGRQTTPDSQGRFRISTDPFEDRSAFNETVDEFEREAASTRANSRGEVLPF